MLKKQVLLLFSSLLIWSYSSSQSFQNFPVSFSSAPAIHDKMEWVDIDGDQDLDLLSFYYDRFEPVKSYVRVYANDEGSFLEVNDPFNSQDPVIPSAYAFGDYDLDGDIDILLLNYNTLRVAKNNGNLTFTFEETSLHTNYSEVSIYWVDTDGDGDLDIVYPPEGLNYVIVINVLGAYTKSVHTLSAFNRTFSWADVNNDGLMDFISSKGQTTTNAVYLHLNKGDGVFEAQQTPLVSGFFDYGKALWSDVDGDQDVDLFITESNNKCSLFKNTFSETGVARLKRAYQFRETQSPLARISDFNNDGLPELLINGDSYPLRKNFLYINQSTTDSLKFNETEIAGSTYSATNLNVIDVDNDHDVDIFLTGIDDYYQNNPIHVFYKNSGAPVTAPVTAPGDLQTSVTESIQLSWTPSMAGAVRYKVELNRNGSLFIPSLSTDAGALLAPENEIPRVPPQRTLRNLPEGAYTWRVQTIDAANNASAFSEYESFTIEEPPVSLALQKLNLTKIQLTWNNVTPEPSLIHIYRRFENEPLGEIGSVPGNVTTYIDDELIANQHYEYVIRSEYSGVYSTPSQSVSYYSVQFDQQTFPSSNNIVAANGVSADIDNDDDYDVMFVGGLDNVYGNLFSLNNNGSGTYTTATVGQPSDYNGSPNFTLRDIDNDGDEDACLVVTEFGGGRISIFENTNGSFAKVFSSDFHHTFLQFAVEDFNNDGRLDLFYSHASTNNTGTHGYQLLYQTSTGDFEDSRFPFVAEGNRTINYFTIGDFNNDGYKDILIPGAQGNTTSVIFENLGGKSFKLNVTGLPIQSYPFAFDYDQDGKTDVLSPGGSAIYVYKGNGDFGFSAAFEVEVTGTYFAGTPQLQAADVDLNGYPDLIMNGGYQFTILQNFGHGDYRPIRYTFAFGDEMRAIITDIERDGDVDIMAMARDQHEGKNLLYLNNIVSPADPLTNQPPSIPANVNVQLSPGAVQLSWNASTDDMTPEEYLTYNIEIRDSNGKVYVHPENNASGSFRKILAAGNVGNATVYYLNDLPAGNYIAKVQAQDAGFMSSAFSGDLPFTIAPGPTNLSTERVLLSKVALHWTDGIPNETQFVVQRKSIESDYETVASLPSNSFTYTDEGLLLNNIYTYRVYAIVNDVPTAVSNTVDWNTALFVPAETTFPNVHGALDVGDFTADGKMDLLMLGGRIVNSSTTDLTSAVFENTGTGWVKHDVGTTTLPYTSVSYFDDFNGDYLLDIYKNGFVLDINSYDTEVYLNLGNNTFGSPADIQHVNDYELITWWDVDSDHDRDVYGLQNGTASPHKIQVLENEGSGNYVLNGQHTPCSNICDQAKAGDFDNDGDEDLLKFQGDAYVLWLNKDGKPTASNVSLPSAGRGRINIVDYNGDGWLDIYFISVDYNFASEKSKLYKNMGPDETGKLRFKIVKDDLPVGDAAYNWADFDHDGDMDLFVTAGRSTIFFNTGNDTFVPYSVPQFNVNFNGSRMIDFDNDGDLDLYVPGYVKTEGSDQNKGYVLYNQLIVDTKGIFNLPPAAPTNLSALQDEEGMHLTWQSGTDDITSGDALSYDVVLYRDGKQITKGSLHPTTGWRNKLKAGMSQGEGVVDHIPHGNYTWRVQAVDQSYLGSPLSAEGEFYFKPRPPALNDTTIYQCGRTIVLTAKGENVEWFSDEGLTNKIASGTYSPESSQIVFATQTIDGVQGIPNKITITIYDKPNKPIVLGENPYSFCENSHVFQIYLQAEGEELRWYKDSNKTTLIAEASPFIVPAADSVYFVSQTVQGCESPVEEVKVYATVIDSRLYYDDGMIYTYEEDGDRYTWFDDNGIIANSDNHFITPASEEGVYRVYITKNNCWEFSLPFVITGIGETDNDEVIKIYPNPTSRDFVVQLNRPEKAALAIIDGTGRTMYRVEEISFIEPVTITSAQWTKGVYLIKVIQGSSVFTRKVVVK